MSHDTGWTVDDGWVTRPLCRLRTAVQPYITAILASVDAHAYRLPPTAYRLPPEREAKVMRAIKEAACGSGWGEARP